MYMAYAATQGQIWDGVIGCLPFSEPLFVRASPTESALSMRLLPTVSAEARQENDKIESIHTMLPTVASPLPFTTGVSDVTSYRAHKPRQRTP
jgi:hypothetical protein